MLAYITQFYYSERKENVFVLSFLKLIVVEDLDIFMNALGNKLPQIF